MFFHIGYGMLLVMAMFLWIIEMYTVLFHMGVSIDLVSLFPLKMHQIDAFNSKI